MTTSVAVQITNDNHPLFVSALIDIHKEEGGLFEWTVQRIEYIELQVGDKIGVDITNAILKKPGARAIIEACVAAEDDQINDHIRDLRTRKIAV